MKKLVIIILTSVILLSSCEDKYIDCDGHQFIEKTTNNSDYSIKIIIWDSYYSDSSVVNHSFTLLENRTLYSKHGIGAWSIDLADSLEVIFDNKKKLIYSPEELRELQSPSIRDEEYCETITPYVFTNSDYEAAEDCNGDCE